MGKLIAILVTILLLVVAFFGLKSCTFGHGQGDGDGGGEKVSTSESATPESDSAESPQIVEIELDEDKIYFDGELCADENDLKNRITSIGSEKEYRFIHDKAIKATYDKVEAILSELEDALEIVIHD